MIFPGFSVSGNGIKSSLLKYFYKDQRPFFNKKCEKQLIILIIYAIIVVNM